jgi:hypothetical protein
MKYRKKPVVIDAVQYNGNNLNEILDKLGKTGTREIVQSLILEKTENNPTEVNLQIKTLEGTMTAKVGDFIIKGINGECYPCKPDIFEKTYEPVD